MRIKRKKSFVNPDGERKELFHIMSRAKYSDRMMLQLARKQTHAPVLNSGVPIHYVMPAIPIQARVEPSVVGAHQQTPQQAHYEGPYEGYEKSKHEFVEELATATVDPGLENIIVDELGDLYNPKTDKFVKDNPASRTRIHEYGKLHGYGQKPPKTPTKTPKSKRKGKR